MKKVASLDYMRSALEIPFMGLEWWNDHRVKPWIRAITGRRSKGPGETVKPPYGHYWKQHSKSPFSVYWTLERTTSAKRAGKRSQKVNLKLNELKRRAMIKLKSIYGHGGN